MKYAWDIRLQDGLRLLSLNQDAVPHLFALTHANRKRLRTWLPWLDNVRQEEDSRRFIENFSHLSLLRRGYAFGIWQDGVLTGVIDAHDVNEQHRHCRLGYWLGAGFEGKGIMTRSASALCDLAFDQWKLNRVEICAAPGNYRSRAIPERLGFTQEGRIRQAEWLYDHFEDHIVYGMLAQEWQTKG